jgi:hypothetical protein
MIKHKLPGDPAVLGMGITSVLFIFFLSEFILFAFAALGLGFVGVSKAADNLRLFDENPGMFSEKSRKNVSDGRHICGFAALASISILIYKGIMYLIH